MPSGKMLRAVNASIRAASHLTAQDKAAIENARSLARIIDQAEGQGTGEFIRASNNASRTLAKVLTDLGLTPAGRKDMPKPPATGGKLAQLRAQTNSAA